MAERDLLQLERFGSGYYHRERMSFALLPPHTTQLLLAAQNENALEAYARRPRAYELDEEQLISEVEWLLAQGLLDAGFRCDARKLEPKASHGALSGPLLTHLQLTRACNLRRLHCFVDSMARPHPRELRTEQLEVLFAELEELGSPVVVLGGGEPMLRPDFWEILEGLRRHHLDASLCTNGTLITPDAARRLAASALREYSISLDGPDAASHERLRGPGSFERAVRGARALVEAGAANVQLRVTVNRQNADRLLELAPLAREIGVSRVSFRSFRRTATGAASEAGCLSLAGAEHRQLMSALLKNWPEDAPLAQVGDGFPTGTPGWTGIIPAGGCAGGTTSASVMFDGKITSCAFVLGREDWSLHERTFRDCWTQSPAIGEWRKEPTSGSAEAEPRRCRARAVGKGGSVTDPDPWMD